LAGFSLVEVLIMLVIMGIISAFTIPKLFQTPNSSLGSKQTARAKDIAFMIVNAYEQYRAVNGTVATTMGATHLSPYMNYVSVDSAGTNSVDGVIGGPASLTCSATNPCLRLHSGGKLRLGQETFSGSNTTNCIVLIFDPDGVASGSSADSYSKPVRFNLYYDGTISTRGTAKTNSCTSNLCPFDASPSSDPSWFTGL
jgi:type II secretory pathway pseudopilin PulG